MNTHDDHFDASRRSALRKGLIAGAGLIAAGSLLRSRPAHAAKANKMAMMYQDKPHNGDVCKHCMQYVPGASPKAPGTCKIVSGKISPDGWCVAYTGK